MPPAIHDVNGFKALHAPMILLQSADGRDIKAGK